MDEASPRAPCVAIITGSRSDWATTQRAADVLAELGIAHECRIVSAHRTPDFLFEYVAAAEGRVNEIAPRTYNSGHYTFGACTASQFEQHVRAVCGLPLAYPALLRPAVMLNLLGDLWRDGAPDWRAVLSHPTARLHLYGKKRAVAGRKRGHVLVVDGEDARADAVAAEIARELEGGAAAEGIEWT